MLSLAESTSGTPSNGTSLSRHTNTNSGAENGDNSPTKKKKITLDAWSTIKRIKNDDFLENDKEGMTRTCVKFGAMIKYSKYKRKGICLTSRAVVRTKIVRLTLNTNKKLLKSRVEKKITIC